jgi:hypothetical protein
MSYVDSYSVSWVHYLFYLKLWMNDQIALQGSGGTTSASQFKKTSN